MDASNMGLGAFLSQELKGEEHPVLYLSHKLFLREQAYSIIEKEGLVVKWAVDSLWGIPFKFVTDHALLRWLNTMKDTNQA